MRDVDARANSAARRGQQDEERCPPAMAMALPMTKPSDAVPAASPATWARIVAPSRRQKRSEDRRSAPAARRWPRARSRPATLPHDEQHDARIADARRSRAARSRRSIAHAAASRRSRRSSAWNAGSTNRLAAARPREGNVDDRRAMRPGPARHHHDAVGEEDRLVDAMGDQQRGRRRVSTRCAAVRCSSGGAGSGRARRRARRGTARAGR